MSTPAPQLKCQIRSTEGRWFGECGEEDLLNLEKLVLVLSNGDLAVTVVVSRVRLGCHAP